MSKQAPDFRVKIVGDLPQPPFDPDSPGDFPSGGGSGGGLPLPSWLWPFSSSPTAPIENRPTQPTTDARNGTGMTGAQLALFLGQILGPAMGGLFAGDPQERKSFEDTDTDPKALMRDNRELLDSIMPLIMGRANAGVSLPSAYVQQPGAFSGGGLPMPIGLVASDPALANPGLLSLPGLSGDSGSITRRPTHDGGLNDSTPDNPDYVDPGGYHDVDPYPDPTPRTAVPRPPTPGGRRRSEAAVAPLFDEGALINPGDDLQQALGSVQLLLDAYR